jgi:acylphosphatase
MTGVIRHVSIRGRVQGVGYRAWVADEAASRNLEGWVRNTRDGSVEALFAGRADVVAAMLAACHRGPPMARVDAVREDDGDPAALNLRRAGEPFSVLPTV